MHHLANLVTPPQVFGQPRSFQSRLQFLPRSNVHSHQVEFVDGSLRKCSCRIAHCGRGLGGAQYSCTAPGPTNSKQISEPLTSLMYSTSNRVTSCQLSAILGINSHTLVRTLAEFSRSEVCQVVFVVRSQPSDSRRYLCLADATGDARIY